MLHTQITDAANSNVASVEPNDISQHNALVVSTVPHLQYDNRIEFFTHPTFGANMNQEPPTGAGREDVHDGTDNAYWTGSNIVGTAITFNSTLIAYDGARSIVSLGSPLGDIGQFAKGSDLDCRDYNSISMWIICNADWDAGDDITIYGWDTDTSSQIGTAVSLQDYFDETNTFVWQNAVIPLTDMGIQASTTLDALRIEVAATGAGGLPAWGIDLLGFDEKEPLIYSLVPRKEKWLTVQAITIAMADAYTGYIDTGAANTYPTMPNLPYDKFLGVSLDSGVIYRRTINGVVTSIPNVTGLLDILQLPGAEVTNYGSDGTNTWLVINYDFGEPITLKYEDNDSIQFIISDDLSGLLRLRISAACKELDRKQTHG